LSRAALISGASRGLGLAIALELAERGCGPLGLGCCRPSYGAKEALGRVRAAGADALLLPGDLCDSRNPGRLVGDFLDFSGGRLDLLVNNAGCFSPATVPRMVLAEWDRQVEVNLSAPFRLIRAAAAALCAARGAVVNIGSYCGSKGTHGGSAYSAAKCGLEALTRTAALELGAFGVRVNAVIPGFLRETDMGAASNPAYVQAVLARSPLARPAEVSTAARAVAELADMPAVTGQIIWLEGRVGGMGLPAFGPA
jgi:NAD(P)-dependent dehydrogenase (short-subunit alcohol dehydrogenase family)